MSATDVPTDLDLDAAMERVLARHGELRRRRASRHRLLSGVAMAVLVLGGVMAWRAGRTPGGFQFGSGTTVSSSTSGIAEPSSSPPGTVVPEHDIVIGNATAPVDGLWTLDLKYQHLTPGGPSPVETTTPAGVGIINAISVERMVPPYDSWITDGTLYMRFSCAAVGGQGTIKQAVLGHIDGQVVIDVEISSGGGPCASDGLGAELRVALPFDPGNVQGAIAENLLRG